MPGVEEIIWEAAEKLMTWHLPWQLPRAGFHGQKAMYEEGGPGSESGAGSGSPLASMNGPRWLDLLSLPLN